MTSVGHCGHHSMKAPFLVQKWGFKLLYGSRVEQWRFRCVEGKVKSEHDLKIQLTRDLRKADKLTAPLPRPIQSKLSVDSTKRLPDPNRPPVVTSCATSIHARPRSINYLPMNVINGPIVISWQHTDSFPFWVTAMSDHTWRWKMYIHFNKVIWQPLFYQK